MVDEKRIKKILPRIFVSGDSKYKNPHSEYVAKKRKLERFERRKRGTFTLYMKKAAKLFDEIEKALNEEIEW